MRRYWETRKTRTDTPMQNPRCRSPRGEESRQTDSGNCLGRTRIGRAFVIQVRPKWEEYSEFDASLPEEWYLLAEPEAT